jgi:hypothetical protein
MSVRRTLPRTALAALAVCALAVGGGALAWACTPKATIDVHGSAGPGGGPPGSSVSTNGQGFGNGPVDITFNGVPIASAVGPSFTATGTVPNVAPGIHYIVATNPEGQAAAAFRVTGSATSPPGNPGSADNPGSSAPGAAATGGRTNGSGPTVPPGSTSGADAAGGGRNSGTVSGGERSRGAPRSGAGAGAGVGLASAGSGESVFADSVGAGAQAARRGASSKSAPSERSASGDLWSGFGAGKGGSPAFADATGPSNGPGGALTLSMAVAGLGLVALLTGVGATGLRRRRALARGGQRGATSD